PGVAGGDRRGVVSAALQARLGRGSLRRLWLGTSRASRRTVGWLLRFRVGIATLSPGITGTCTTALPGWPSQDAPPNRIDLSGAAARCQTDCRRDATGYTFWNRRGFQKCPGDGRPECWLGATHPALGSDSARWPRRFRSARHHHLAATTTG